MEKIRFFLAFVVLTALGLAATLFAQGNLQTAPASAQADGSYEITMRRDLLALMMAYPEHIAGVEKGNGGAVYVVMRSGAKILYDDKKQKTFDQKLANADLQDMMEQDYPLHEIQTVMAGNNDPGRIRDYEFFHEVYGRSKKEIERNLTTASLGSGGYPFNRCNQAAQSLQAAFAEVNALCTSDRAVYRFVYPLGGTYNYRCIAGTDQLSPHAFGLAIDLHSDKADYWRWATREQGQQRLDCYPQNLVAVFEKHYFIWGGKWAHFDFLHFEYRPELIIKAKYLAGSDDPANPWQFGFPDAPNVREAVDKINQALK